MRNLSQTGTSLTRRRLLQGTLGGTAGLLAWHQGWPHLRTAWAQKGAPSGQVTWAIHVTIAPTWFDPAETTGVITPFMFLYALHDALVKPMPDGLMSPCLATKWSESADGLAYDFELRQGVKFPQRRCVHGRGRAVQLRALQRLGRHGPEKVRQVYRDRQPAPGALPSARALARFFNILRYTGHRSGLDCPQEICREGR